jgi:parallel beta-helix repeat protein
MVASEDSTVRVTSLLSSGPGSIREAINAANASQTATHIVSELEAGAVVYVFRELPAVTGYGTEIDGAGLTLKGGTCRRDDGRRGCSGLVIAGPRVRVKAFSTTGFMFDGVAVREGGMDVVIEDVHAFENQDDGIGISAGATGVLVQNCVLERNGFRTKGKGVLVFDYAEATLRNNTVQFNRDGVTISRGASAALYDNTIVDNFDKGFGVIGAQARGRGNIIKRNGLPSVSGEAAPNGDGVRITSDSTVNLEDTVIAENGDVGVVATDLSKVTLSGGSIADNRGVGINVRDQAVVELSNVEITGNYHGEFVIGGEGKLVRTGDASPEGEVGEPDEPD